MSTDEDRNRGQPILVGEVLKAFGLRGEVTVKNLSENPERFREGSTLMLGAAPERSKPTKIVAVRVDERFRDRLIVVFEGVLDREAAEGLRGNLIFVAVGDLPEAEQDAYWEHELIGAEVFDIEGRRRGRISAIHARTEQDLWEVETGDGAVLVPAAKDLIVSVDPARGKVVIDPPKGLFDAP